MRFLKDFQKILKHECENTHCASVPSCHPEWSEAESNPEGARHSLGVYEGIDSKKHY